MEKGSQRHGDLSQPNQYRIDHTGMNVVQRTWPYGTQRACTILTVEGRVVAAVDSHHEGHIMDRQNRPELALVKEGDKGVLTFVAPGRWQFSKDEQASKTV